MFIAFEGLDGSGSSTHSRHLAERLEKNGRPTLVTKEPTGDTPVGKMIREILQHKWEVSPEGLQLLFCADRAEHLKNVIEPALANGQIVITDRYLFSTIAYGSMSVDYDWLKELNKSFLLPDITFLLKAAPEICLQRIVGRGSEFELFERKEKLEKIWEGYARLAEDLPNIHVLDGNRKLEVVDEEIWKILSANLEDS
jgi:dTMP kinase